MTWPTDVRDFIDRFHQDRRDSPGWPGKDAEHLRLRLIREEYCELTSAWVQHDLPETVDGIIDLIYVLIGALHALGVDPDPIWDAVHEANMSKSQEKDVYGKILKGDDWVAPDIEKLLEGMR